MYHKTSSVGDDLIRLVCNRIIWLPSTQRSTLLVDHMDTKSKLYQTHPRLPTKFVKCYLTNGQASSITVNMILKTPTASWHDM